MNTFFIKLYTRIVAGFYHFYSSLKKLNLFLNPMVKFGRNFYIEKKAGIRTVAHWGCGNVYIGDDCFLGEGALLIPQGGVSQIGNNTSVN